MIKPKPHILFLFFFLFVCVLSSGARDVIRVNEGWRFSLSDDPAAAQPGFDDSSWRSLDLPHDWAFENGYSPDGAQGERGGYTGGGIGWYRKCFDISVSDFEGKKVFLGFDAVYMNSEVWVNGNYLGKRPYGYISFSYDLSGCLQDGENVVSVRVDNSLEPSARWYHGCGIYGNVHLTVTAPVHFKEWGTFISTPEIGEKNATVSVRSEISGWGEDTSVDFIVSTPDGNPICSNNGIRLSDGIVVSKLSVMHPSLYLWSPDSPSLYTLTGILKEGGQEIDRISIPFGIRHVEWKPDTGFWLNGENLKLNGVCEHLEGGPLGAAWNEKMMRWKLQLLKDMGCNAIRTAHNPQLPVFYDLCDRMGILVMDEAFDGWRRKADHDYGAHAFDHWWERDLRDMIRRDRNHPSVVIYSVGNETRGDVAESLVSLCHEEDPTRAVTSGHSGSEYMDVLGINGHSEKRSFLLGYKPGPQAFIGTETPHTWQVRGFYRTHTWYRDGFPNPKQDPFETPDLTDKEIFGYDWTSPASRTNGKQIFNSSYDNGFVRINARQNLEFLRDRPWYAGHFRWTGFDYLGEAGYVHGGWPFRAFMGGVIDMAGFPKDHYYLYQSQWRPEIDMVHILPHWTHPHMEPGTAIPVWVYTTGDEAELLINGRSLGRKRKDASWDRMQCDWIVPWEPGEIEAVAYRGGREIARSRTVTSNQPSRLSVVCDNSALQSGPDDMAIITVSQTDAAGTIYPYGENRIWFHHDDGIIVRSAENGNPVDTETNYLARSKRAFFGLLRIFVQASGSREGLSFLAASICGDKALKISDEISIEVQQTALRGNLPRRDIRIYYTTDGAVPSRRSKLYTKPFAVADGTTVRAAVYEGKKLLIMMEEKFGAGEGLYWGEPGEETVAHHGMKAVNARLDKAAKVTVDNMEVVEIEPGGAVNWYQENDGSPRDAVLTVNYAQKRTGIESCLILLHGDQVLREIVFPDYGDTDWREIRVPVPLVSGANEIILRRKDDLPAPYINFIWIDD